MNELPELKFHDHKREYFLTYLSVALANPTFAYYNFTVVFAVIGYLLFLKKGLKFDPLFMVIVISLFFLSLGQSIMLQNFEFTSFIGLYLIFLTPYFVFRILKNAFWEYFIRLMYYLAVIALFFWFAQNFIPGASELFNTISKNFYLDPISGESIIVYNLEWHREGDLFGLMKNAGFTGEGGIYSGILIIAAFFNTLITRKLFHKRNLVFYFSILTTTSTAGYIALFILMVGMSVSLKSNFHKLVIFPALAILSYLLIFELPFLYAKVETYYVNESNMYNANQLGMRRGRFNSAFREVDLIVQNPIFGRGIYKYDRAVTEEERDFGITGTQMGVVNLISKFGIPFFIIFMASLWTGFQVIAKYYGHSRIFASMGFLSFLAINLGQVMYTSPFILILVYSVIFKHRNENLSNNIEAHS